MIITDKIRKELVGKNLICQGGNTSLTDGKAYKVIKTEFYESNKSKTLVTVLNDLKQECNYALDWFINEQEDIIVYDNLQEYKLSELLKFEEGTRFKDVNSENVLQISEGLNKHISVIKENKLVPIIFCERWLNTTYIKLDEKPISFDKICDVVNENHFAEFVLKFRDNNFNGTFNKILEVLSKYGCAHKALQEGKWYIKHNNKTNLIVSHGGNYYGRVGKLTKFKDYLDRPLYVGDVVLIVNNNEHSSQNVVVSTNNDSNDFIMGIASDCNNDDGTINDFWKIIKIKDFSEMKEGYQVNTIRYELNQ